MGGAGRTQTALGRRLATTRAGCRCTNCSRKCTNVISDRSSLAETSHYGSAARRGFAKSRAKCAKARALGIPLEGVCLYPILDRFDWEDPSHWHNSGLWDMQRDGEGPLLDGYSIAPYASALKCAQTTAFLSACTDAVIASTHWRHTCNLLCTQVRRALHRAPANTSVTNQEEECGTNSVILTFSHLRWDFVYQRPQHLLSRLAQIAPCNFCRGAVCDRRAAGLAVYRTGPTTCWSAVRTLPAARRVSSTTRCRI